MTIVYDKDGKSYKVPYKIDVKEWLKDGYTLEAQEQKQKPRDILIARASELELEFAENISNKALKALVDEKEAEQK